MVKLGWSRTLLDSSRARSSEVLRSENPHVARFRQTDQPSWLELGIVCIVVGYGSQGNNAFARIGADHRSLDELLHRNQACFALDAHDHELVVRGLVHASSRMLMTDTQMGEDGLTRRARSNASSQASIEVGLLLM